jgi:hypothetical protein
MKRLIAFVAVLLSSLASAELDMLSFTTTNSGPLWTNVVTADTRVNGYVEAVYFTCSNACPLVASGGSNEPNGYFRVSGTLTNVNTYVSSNAAYYIWLGQGTAYIGQTYGVVTGKVFQTTSQTNFISNSYLPKGSWGPGVTVSVAASAANFDLKVSTVADGIYKPAKVILNVANQTATNGAFFPRASAYTNGTAVRWPLVGELLRVEIYNADEAFTDVSGLVIFDNE